MSLVTPIQHRVCGGISIGFHRGCCMHLDKQVLLPLFLLPDPGWLVYATSLARNARAVCVLRLETVMAYMRFMRIARDFVRMMRSYSSCFHVSRKRDDVRRTETWLMLQTTYDGCY